MKALWKLLLVLSMHCLHAESIEHWVKSIEGRLDLKAADFLIEVKGPKEPVLPLPKEQDPSKAKVPCTQCMKNSSQTIEDPRILIFMSFAVPESIWLSLSKELEGRKGVFVLRGLPENSFEELASKMMDLKQQGMKAEVQIHPKLFTNFNISQVPSIVIKSSSEQTSYDKITGTVSLGYALNLFEEKTYSGQATSIEESQSKNCLTCKKERAWMNRRM